MISNDRFGWGCFRNFKIDLIKCSCDLELHLQLCTCDAVDYSFIGFGFIDQIYWYRSIYSILHIVIIIDQIKIDQPRFYECEPYLASQPPVFQKNASPDPITHPDGHISWPPFDSVAPAFRVVAMSTSCCSLNVMLRLLWRIFKTFWSTTIWNRLVGSVVAVWLP